MVDFRLEETDPVVPNIRLHTPFARATGPGPLSKAGQPNKVEHPIK